MTCVIHTNKNTKQLLNLVSLCQERGLPTTGTKEEMARLIVANEEIQSEHDVTVLENDVSEDQQGAAAIPKLEPLIVGEKSSPYFFRDVEEGIEEYNADGSRDITAWFREFEDISNLARWSDEHKFIMCRKKLTGVAKSFLATLRGVITYAALKRALLAEFATVVRASDVYRQLASRKKKKDESALEFIYCMQKLAQSIDIEEEDLCEFIVDGFSSDETTRAILYEATTISQLKRKIVLRERADTKSEVDKKKRPLVEQTNKHQRVTPNTRNTKCYNCGQLGGTKCYSCGVYGHKASECMKKQAGTAATNLVTNSDDNVVIIKFGDCLLHALFDSGSGYNIISNKAFQRIGAPPVENTIMTFNGFGGTRTKAIGRFFADVCVCAVPYKNMPFFVVPDGTMAYDALLGRESLQFFSVEVTKDAVKLIPRSNEKEQVAESNVFLAEVFPISTDLGIIVPSDYEQQIIAMIDKYGNEQQPPKESPITMKIVTNEGAVPFRQTPRRFSPPENEVVEQQIEQWLEQGVIQKSSSDFASRVVIVKKKNGKYRLCVDYRKLNSMVLKDGFPIPLIEEVLEKLQRARYFTVMDLTNGFFHVPIEESSRKYTAFATKTGLYEFKRAPFGFCNSPAVFIRFVNTIFQLLINQNTLDVYMDDIVIHGVTPEECLEKMEVVFGKIKEYGLKVNWEKCAFLQRSIVFLGHRVEEGTISPGEEKIRAVKNFKPPQNVKAVQAFLGLTGFFRKFIKSYAIIARPLTNLLKKNVELNMGQLEMEAFRKLKQMLIKEPILRLYDRDAETEVHTDASKYGFGAVLLQKFEGKFYPIWFWSKKTTPGESKQHSYILEAKAIYLAVKKWRHYLLGIKFRIVTDCIAFKQTIKKEDTPREVTQWVMFLQDFDYEVEHRPGERLRHVDCLSRYPEQNVLVISEVTAKIHNQQLKDESLKAIIEILKERPYECYKMKGNLLYKTVEGSDLLVIPKSMERQIIVDAHNVGHFGHAKTMHNVKQLYFIPHLEHKIKQIIESCVKCIMHNRKLGKREGLLHQIDKGNIVDAFSKFVWLYPTKSTGTEEVILRLNSWTEIFGNPERIITDRGSAFTSNNFVDYLKDRQIEHIINTTGVPRGNGQVEIVNKVVLSTLAKLSSDEPSRWYKSVGLVQRAINSTVHSTTKRTPFYAMFGVTMRKGDNEQLQNIINEELYERFETDRAELRRSIREEIERAQIMQKRNYDKTRKVAAAYKLGDLVAIKRTQFIAGRKLAHAYLGPYEVIGANRNDRYKVKRAACCEGPNITVSSADNMKLWCYADLNEESLEDNGLSGQADCENEIEKE
uniref:RNA-directed DNA polymerase n=1 Tax=Anopheles atroparvus TaxID=41427 RepID=A0AAG5DTA5_ANOAO